MNLWTLIFIFLGISILYEDEKEYLNTKFQPGDGARPFIKSRYSQLTPDGNINGYILRKRIPFWMKISHCDDQPYKRTTTK